MGSRIRGSGVRARARQRWCFDCITRSAGPPGSAETKSRHSAVPRSVARSRMEPCVVVRQGVQIGGCLVVAVGVWLTLVWFGVRCASVAMASCSCVGAGTRTNETLSRLSRLAVADDSALHGMTTQTPSQGLSGQPRTAGRRNKGNAGLGSQMRSHRNQATSNHAQLYRT